MRSTSMWLSMLSPSRGVLPEILVVVPWGCEKGVCQRMVRRDSHGERLCANVAMPLSNVTGATKTIFAPLNQLYARGGQYPQLKELEVVRCRQSGPLYSIGRSFSNLWN